HDAVFTADHERQLEEALLAVDAALLQAYELPSDLEHQLLDFFRGQKRPALGGRTEYFPQEFKAPVSLEEYVRGWQIESLHNQFSDEHHQSFREMATRVRKLTAGRPH